MSDVALRGLAIGVVLLVVTVVVYLLRARAQSGGRHLGRVGLDEGIYLFTSARCLDCGPARDTLRARLGNDGFIELAWEENSDVFDRSISEVPATLVVFDSRSARLFTGHPTRIFSIVDP